MEERERVGKWEGGREGGREKEGEREREREGGGGGGGGEERVLNFTVFAVRQPREREMHIQRTRSV